MARVSEIRPPDPSAHRSNPCSLYMTHSLPIISSQLALLPNMLNNSTFYVFSRRISCLGEKLQQRDRLIDAQVFIKTLNTKEIRTVVNCNRRPCASTILLLASLLRPHPQLFPLHFDLNVVATPHIFYAFDFKTRHLPPPPGNSYGFNILFALRVGSHQMLAVHLAKFFFTMAAHVRAVSTNIKLWDLTFRVDPNYVFGTLQFETRSRHEKVQADAYFCMDSLIASHPLTEDAIFYRELSGLHLPDHAVIAYITQINWCLRDLTESGEIYEWQSYHVVF